MDMKLLKFDADEQGWIRLDSYEDFLGFYPPMKYGHYRPQPHMTPEKYPCYFKEVAFHYVTNGADESVLAFIYDFDEGTEQEELAFQLKHS
jgi:hypothetical protein